MTAAHLERNLPLIDALYVAQNAIFWIPVFVLYFSGSLDASGVFALEAVYYAAIVVLEVPSGWMSDRIGRRWTLVLSGLGWALGALLIGAFDGIAWFACGQILFAVGRSFASGTDSSVLYETLAALGREHEVRDRLGRASSLAFLSLAATSLVGGALGAYDLRWAYYGSVVTGLWAVGAAWLLTEPPRTGEEAPPAVQWRDLRSALEMPALRVVFASIVAMNVFVHIPYELAQPWLDLALEGRGTAFWSGVIVAIGFGVASLGSRFAGPLAQRVGFRGGMALAMGWAAATMALMAIGPWLWLVPVLALRSLPTGLMGPLVDAEVHPRIASSVRATYLSTQSLAGRLAFSAVMAALAGWAGEVWTMEMMREILLFFGVLAALGACALLVRRPLE